MACLYRHIRTDLNCPFYIGIGKSVDRAYSKTHRNSHWESIVRKTGYEVDILFDEIPYSLAKEKEREFILLYGRKADGGILCNITMGGDGVLGIRHSNEARKKMSIANKGKSISDWHKKRISEFHLGKSTPDYVKMKMSEAAMGEKNHRYGVSASNETRSKMSASAKKGALNHASKLTETDVIEIRRMSSIGIGQRKIAKQFCIAKSNVASILNRKTWKHI